MMEMNLLKNMLSSPYIPLALQQALAQQNVTQKWYYDNDLLTKAKRAEADDLMDRLMNEIKSVGKPMSMHRPDDEKNNLDVLVDSIVKELNA